MEQSIIEIGDILPTMDGRRAIVYEVNGREFLATVDGLRHKYIDCRHVSCLDDPSLKEVKKLSIMGGDCSLRKAMKQLAKAEQEIQEAVRKTLVGRKVLVADYVEDYSEEYKGLKNCMAVIIDTFVDQGEILVWLEDYPHGVLIDDVVL